MNIDQAGAAAVYLDGRLIYDFGEDGTMQSQEKSKRYRDYALFSFAGNSQHVFAIRYANYSTATFHRAGHEAGFYFFLGQADKVIAGGIRRDHSDLIFHWRRHRTRHQSGNHGGDDEELVYGSRR
jgi:hypothetical protein